jgi:N-acetylglutamate synthase-like GNAT family acetyltransferase
LSDAPRVRAATLGDAAALAHLLGELGYPADAAAVAPRITRMLARNDQKILIAEDERGALGLLAMHVFPMLEYEQDAALITALVITERARGTGIGRELVTRAEALAIDAGATRFMVTTHVRRAGAHAFYERLGFELTGRRYVKELKEARL